MKREAWQLMFYAAALLAIKFFLGIAIVDWIALFVIPAMALILIMELIKRGGDKISALIIYMLILFCDLYSFFIFLNPISLDLSKPEGPEIEKNKVKLIKFEDDFYGDCFIISDSRTNPSFYKIKCSDRGGCFICKLYPEKEKNVKDATVSVVEDVKNKDIGYVSECYSRYVLPKKYRIYFPRHLWQKDVMVRQVIHVPPKSIRVKSNE